MKIVCLADTHGMHSKLNVPDGDILVHAGDFCGHGHVLEIAAFNEWLGKLPHPSKVVIAGNHDHPLEHDHAARALLSNATYLQDTEITIAGIRLYGSPWQPAFRNWSFNLPRGEALRRKWDLIPAGVDVLITHGPPYRIADLTVEGEHVGCEELLIAIKRLQPKFHICGHIHGGYGRYLDPDLGVTVINASTCTEEYRPINPPLVIEW